MAEKKRPSAVWTFTILNTLGILYALGITLFESYLVASKINVPQSLLNAIVLLLISPLIVTNIIFIYKFFMMEKKSLLWMYISFGVSVFYSLITINIFLIIVTLFWGWVVRDYIKNKKINGTPLFK
ncbi:MAG: hypothetical protein V1866_07410 [archaeon]